MKFPEREMQQTEEHKTRMRICENICVAQTLQEYQWMHVGFS